MKYSTFALFGLVGAALAAQPQGQPRFEGSGVQAEAPVPSGSALPPPPPGAQQSALPFSNNKARAVSPDTPPADGDEGFFPTGTPPPDATHAPTGQAQVHSYADGDEGFFPTGTPPPDATHAPNSQPWADSYPDGDEGFFPTGPPPAAPSATGLAARGSNSYPDGDEGFFPTGPSPTASGTSAGIPFQA
ncbi:hypothetical protein BDW74DRAFT_73337 [Aspergillus multicolor]|uniref:uncharacterized protein n=1 Tax=Aspergillus multicolor TaxID=41759 RepID=UPI003CCD0C95